MVGKCKAVLAKLTECFGSKDRHVICGRLWFKWPKSSTLIVRNLRRNIIAADKSRRSFISIQVANTASKVEVHRRGGPTSNHCFRRARQHGPVRIARFGIIHGWLSPNKICWLEEGKLCLAANCKHYLQIHVSMIPSACLTISFQVG